jgi:ketosteroid isomerase-like protein
MADTAGRIRSYYESYGRHDLEALLAMMDEDVHIYFPVDDRPKVGKEPVRAAWTLSFTVVIPDIRQQLHTVITDGDHAAVRFTEYGTVHIPEEPARKAGLDVRPRPYAIQMGSFFTFTSQGLIREIRSFWDTGDFARQLGIDIAIIAAMSAGAST